MKYKMIAERNIIWAAGVIDGEGCILLKKVKGGKNDLHTLDLEVSMTDYHAVKKLHEIFGIGSFRPSRRKKKQANHRQAWRWVCTSNDAMEVIELVLPYLIVKREQAELATKFSELKKKHPGRKGLSQEEVNIREEMFLKMKELKQVEYTIEDYWEE